MMISMINRMKNFAMALFVISSPSFVSAENSAVITADPFPGENPGEYVYYHDTRRGVYGSKEPVSRLIGLMKVDDKHYIIRVFNLKDGKSFLFLGRYILSNGGMEFSAESIQGDTKDGTLILADLLNLLNYLGSETAGHSSELNGRNDLLVSSVWESYNRKLVNRYRWWIPFYKTESCENMESDSFGKKGYVSLKLVCFGSVSQADPEIFTRINRLPVFYRNKIENSKYRIPAAEKMSVKLDSISFMLDRNWHFEKASPSAGTVNDTYWLKKFTGRDAQIGIESIDIKNIKLEKNEIETFVGTLRFQSCVITDTVDINLKEKILSLSLWDADSGTSTYTRYISLGVKNNIFTIINFSAFDFIYFGNVEYFDAVLKR